MTGREHIVIAGAGIAGLTASLCLVQAGYRVTLCERTRVLSEVGAGIQIAPNAGRVLADLGLSSALEASAVEPRTLEIRGGTNGRLTIKVPTSEFRRRYGFPYYVLHRADLQTLLLSAVSKNPHIVLRLATTVSHAQDAGGGVQVHLRSDGGSSVETAGALIAADGVWSSLRRIVSPSTGTAAPIGRTAWRAIVSTERARRYISPDRVGLWLGPHAHFVHYPVSRNTAVNFVAVVDERWNQTGWNATANGAELGQHFAKWPTAIRGLIELPSAWQKFTLNTVDPAGNWSRGRIALVGDAAHAMAPFLAQGAAMAIEDAAVLANRMAGAVDIAAALRAYEDERKPRVVRVARASRRIGDVYEASGALAAARDMALAAGGHRFVMARNDWLYKWKPPATG